MFLLKLLPKFTSETTDNPQLDKARKKHDNLPKTEHDKFYKLAIYNHQQARIIAEQRYCHLAQMLRAVVKEHYSSAEQNKINTIIIRAIDFLASQANIFPDMDYPNVWYTDHYDLIELAKDMGLGDETLPHWDEELNLFNRYLELAASDLVQILLCFSEEALLDGYQSGADVKKWFRYILRETLKSRKRFSRYKQKQSETLCIPPKTLGIDNWDKN